MGNLTALKVARLTKPGMHSDGDGLYLQISRTGTRSWIFRFQINGRARCMGLGGAGAVSLARARELAVEPRRLCAEKIDPLDARRAQRAAAAPAATFREVAESYLAAHQATWNPVHRTQWRNTLERAVYPMIGDMPVQSVDTAAVMLVLRPLWTSVPETASRIRGRIETILNAAKAAGLRTGENPAVWRGHLQNLLPKPRAVKKVEHHAALPYRDLPGFMAELRSRPSISARAVEFTILTAARRSETLGARWDEINFDERIWTIPASRMKNRKEHRVPLSGAAFDLLRSLYGFRSNEFVFPGVTAQRLSDASLLKMLEILGRRDLTMHGFRSTFRDWAGETTSFPSEVVEVALAHTVGSAVERAYRRGDLFEKRAQLMTEWAKYCAGLPIGNRMPTGGDRATWPTPLTAEEISRLADLASVPDGSRTVFSEVITEQLGDIIAEPRKPGPWSPALEKTVASLRLAQQALDVLSESMEESMEEMEYFGPILPVDEAPLDLEQYLAGLPDRIREHPVVQLTAYIDQFLQRANGGAYWRDGSRHRHVGERRGRPRGTRANESLENIAGILIRAAFEAGGNFSVDEKGDGGGTLVGALKILAPHFPKGIIPNVPSRKTLRRVRKEDIEHMQRSAQWDSSVLQQREEEQSAKTVEERAAIEAKYEAVRARLYGPEKHRRK